MNVLRFRATMRIRDGNPYVLVSAARARTLRQGWRRPMPVHVQVNGEPSPPWRINLMPTGAGSFYLYLHGDVRKASRTKVGDVVSIDLRFDSAYRGGPIHPMPSWVREATPREPRRRARLGRASAQPAEGDPPLSLLADDGRSAEAQRYEGTTRAVGGAGALYGALVEGWTVARRTPRDHGHLG